MIKEDEVKLIAYSIWQEEGCQDGRDCEQWLKAEIIWEKRKKQGAAIIEPEKASKPATKQAIPKPSTWKRK